MSVSRPRALQVAAMVAAAIAAIAFLPSLLRAPEPPPLDPRIGLTGVAAEGGAPRVADASAGGATPDPRKREEPEHREAAGDAGRRAGREQRGGHQPHDDGGRPGHPDPPPAEPDEEGGSVPTSTPAPAPVTPVPPTVTPAPVPPADPEPEPPATPDQPQGQPPGIAQFGP